MPEDCQNPSVLFLNEDLDTIPERHAFLGNYRRFCSTIVEHITKRRPFEAFPYIMNNVEMTISSIRTTEPPFSCRHMLPNDPLLVADRARSRCLSEEQQCVPQNRCPVLCHRSSIEGIRQVD